MGLKKLQLDVEEDLDFLLFGLVSQLKASRLAFFLNQQLLFKFSRDEDLRLPDFNPKADISFSRFLHRDEENHLDFSMVANKEFGNCLFTDLKQFDYLLTVRGGLEFFVPGSFLADCRKVMGLQLVAVIDNPKVKSKLSWIV